jgi:hypothetical protein
MPEVRCQTEIASNGSAPTSKFERLAYRLEWHLKNEGFWVTLVQVSVAGCRWVHLLPRTSETLTSAVDRSAEILNLQPGDLVEVKSEEEIRRTLNRQGKQRGLYFAEGMRRYCNQQMRVLRRVERICVENQPGVIRTLRHTVLLDGAVCDGQTFRCDRMCPYMWREIWLRKMDSQPTAVVPSSTLEPPTLTA